MRKPQPTEEQTTTTKICILALVTVFFWACSALIISVDQKKKPTSSAPTMQQTRTIAPVKQMKAPQGIAKPATETLHGV